MTRFARLPSGKIKYYWVERDPSWIQTDQVDGVHGVRIWLLDVIPDKESILDIGCGPGHISEIFKIAGRKNQYLGVDNSTSIIEYAQSLFPQAKFDCFDANFLPYEDNSFDNCILFTIIEAMADFRKPIEEAVRIARKRVIITTFIPLVETPDRNEYIVNNLSDYVVSINKDRFLNHISQFGTITSGVLQKNGKVEYWWWIINENA